MNSVTGHSRRLAASMFATVINTPVRLLHILGERRLVGPMAALTFGSILGVGFLVVRCLVTQRFAHSFLVWNLFLAWIPLGFALLAENEFRNGGGRKWLLGAMAAAWLLFYPNAPYIFTDITHVRFWFHNQFWTDLMLILLFAFTALLVGFLSLYVMQSLVAERYGRMTGWLFVVITTALSSFGVYLGRFLRLNSWDAFVRPGHLFNRVEGWIQSSLFNGQAAAFLVLFAAFLFASYVMLYGFMHLSPVQRGAATHPSPNNI